MYNSEVLTDNERKFCEEYVKCYNASQAYQTVYGCEKTTANAQGWRMLKKEKVQKYVKELQAELVRRWGDVASILVEELVTDVVTKDEQGKHTSSWQKSVELLQKQLGLQNQNIKVDETKTFVINVVDVEDEESEG